MRGKEWKQTRAIITPTFSTKKLKTMIPLIEKSCVNLNEKIKGLSEGNQSIEMWRIFGQFTMETVLATAFGCQVNILKGEGNELTEIATGVFTNLSNSFLLLFHTLRSQFTSLQPLLNLIFSRSKIAIHSVQLRNVSLQILKARKQMTDVKVEII
jgi:cytochrome P450 family 3 subfamily A